MQVGGKAWASEQQYIEMKERISYFCSAWSTKGAGQEFEQGKEQEIYVMCSEWVNFCKLRWKQIMS